MYKCTDCKYCLLEDYGYSNYTVEGTYVNCLKYIHPEGVFDRWYGEDERLYFADKCYGFVAGECVVVDCEHELNSPYNAPLSIAYTDDPEVAILIDTWETNKNK